MTIKRSSLEKKWYYRVAKVFFLLFPWIATVAVFIKNGIISSNILQKNFSVVLQNNINIIVYAVIGLIVYFVALNLFSKIFFYIAFGGLENDIPENTSATTQTPTVTGSISEEDKKQISFYLFILFIIAIIYYAYFIWKPTGININQQNNNNNTGCISTGCGKQWHCVGTYYEDGLQRRINGCVQTKASEVYSSWSGTCRQCP